MLLKLARTLTFVCSTRRSLQGFGCQCKVGWEKQCLQRCHVSAKMDLLKLMQTKPFTSPRVFLNCVQDLIACTEPV